MSTLKTIAWSLAILAILGGGAAFVVVNYSWVFAKHVHGEIMDVQRVMNPTAILGQSTGEQMHSYAVLIRGDDGKLYTSSSDDRQWQVARKGYCVDALLYVYPPWNLANSGTYFNARMNELKLCPGKTEPPPEPTQTPAAPSTGAFGTGN